MSKKCPNCGGKETRKDGRRAGIQRHRCIPCGKRFSGERREKKVLEKKLWNAYVFGKQTVRELALEYSKDRRTIHRMLEMYEPPKKIHDPRAVHIVVDATYFGERKKDSSWCVVVARDHETKEDLVWKFTKRETTSVYVSIREELELLGYTIQSVTGDGFSGISSAFRGIPYQMCHVHTERLVLRGTTRNPQTEAGEVLLAIVRTIHSTKKKIFYKRIREYFHRYGSFLDEWTTNPLTGERYRTHKNLRSAAMSLLNLSPQLFTYTANTHIAKNTNSLEGRFSHIKEVLAIHRGLSFKQKKKVIHSLLLASTIAPDHEKLSKIL